jgi:hypothetical protein
VEPVLKCGSRKSPRKIRLGAFQWAAQDRFGVWRQELEQKRSAAAIWSPRWSPTWLNRLLHKLALIFHLAQDGREEEIPLIEAVRTAQARS